MFLEHDQDGSIKQQIIAVLAGLAAILSAYAARLRAKISKQSYSNEFLQKLVNDSVARAITESQEFKSLERKMDLRIDALEFNSGEDRKMIMNSVDRLARGVSELSRRLPS